jgi:hypothetical protein
MPWPSCNDGKWGIYFTPPTPRCIGCGSNVLSVTNSANMETSVTATLTRAEIKQATLSYLTVTQQIKWVTGTADACHFVQLNLRGDREMVATAGTEDLTVEAFGQKIVDGVIA